MQQLVRHRFLDKAAHRAEKGPPVPGTAGADHLVQQLHRLPGKILQVVISRIVFYSTSLYVGKDLKKTTALCILFFNVCILS
jgi:hypothetical protein